MLQNEKGNILGKLPCQMTGSQSSRKRRIEHIFMPKFGFVCQQFTAMDS